MSYRLEVDRPLGVSVREVLLEQLDDAIGRLREHAADEPVETIHEARKDLKKARAVLRLVRTALPSAERRADLDALRDAGRRLAPFRDHDVAGETVDELFRREPDVVDEATWALVRQALQEAAERAVTAPREQEAVAVAGELARVRDELADRLGDDTVRRKHLRAGLRRTYRRGRKARKHAERGDDACRPPRLAQARQGPLVPRAPAPRRLARAHGRPGLGARRPGRRRSAASTTSSCSRAGCARCPPSTRRRLRRSPSSSAPSAPSCSARRERSATGSTPSGPSPTRGG